jgi:Protein of unknown function (DUF2917)
LDEKPRLLDHQDIKSSVDDQKESAMKRPEFGFFKSVAEKPASSPIYVGSWPLQPTKVISLFPLEDSILTIKQGKVWATINLGSDNRADGYGDYFLSVGDSLIARKGQHLVFESTRGDLPVFFDFTPI